MVGGELTIDARSQVWRATIGGFTANVERNGESTHIRAGGGHGEFRGRIVEGADKSEAIGFSPPILTLITSGMRAPSLLKR